MEGVAAVNPFVEQRASRGWTLTRLWNARFAIVRRDGRRRTAEKADHRHRQLLRARLERHRGRAGAARSPSARRSDAVRAGATSGQAAAAPHGHVTNSRGSLPTVAS